MARELVVRIVGDSRSFERSLKKSEAAAKGFTVSMKSVAKSALAFGGIASAAALATRAIRASAEEFAEQARVTAQTEAALRSTGGVANVTAKEIRDLADEVLRYSGIDDEAVQSAENLLLTFRNVRNVVGENNRIFDRATKAAVDLSVAGFGDLSTTAKQLGKALQDPVRGMTALRRAGVTFTADQQALIKRLVETGQELEAQKLILAEVETQVGGSAEAYGKTLPGQIAKAEESLKNLGGEIAKVFVPVVEGSVNAVQDLVDVLDRLNKKSDVLGGGGGPLQRIKDQLDEVIGRAPDWFKAFGPAGPVAFLFQPPTPPVLNFAKAWDSVADAIKGAAENLAPFRKAFVDISAAFAGAARKFGPKAPQAPFVLPGPLRLAQAQAGVTAGTRDDVAVARRIRALIERRIQAGTLTGDRLITALGVLEAAQAVITGAIDEETRKRKEAAEKEADARKKHADALKEAAEKMKQRVDQALQTIGQLFQGPILAPDDAQRRAALGLTAGPDPRALLADIRAQNQAAKGFRNTLTRLTRAGAPSGFVQELLAGGLSAQAGAIAAAPRALQRAIFEAFRQREALARQIAERPLRVFVTVNLDGRRVASSVAAHNQRNGKYQATQRRGPGGGSVAVKPA